MIKKLLFKLRIKNRYNHNIRSPFSINPFTEGFKVPADHAFLFRWGRDLSTTVAIPRRPSAAGVPSRAAASPGAPSPSGGKARDPWDPLPDGYGNPIAMPGRPGSPLAAASLSQSGQCPTEWLVDTEDAPPVPHRAHWHPLRRSILEL